MQAIEVIIGCIFCQANSFVLISACGKDVKYRIQGNLEYGKEQHEDITYEYKNNLFYKEIIARPKINPAQMFLSLQVVTLSGDKIL